MKKTHLRDWEAETDPVLQLKEWEQERDGLKGSHVKEMIIYKVLEHLSSFFGGREELVDKWKYTLMVKNKR